MSDKILIASACKSNYDELTAFVDCQNHVYLGKGENYFPSDDPLQSYYDNADASLQFISDNVTMYHFLYGDGWPLPQEVMLRQHCFRKDDFMEFATLRDGILSRFSQRREVTFAGEPFIPPRRYMKHRRKFHTLPSR